MALYWERLWPRLWPAVAILGTFFALALFDILPRLPASVHVLVLVGFVGAFVYAVLHLLPALKPVEPAAARRRLDAAGGIERPLASLDDRLAAGEGDRLASALWRRHRERMATAADKLPVHWPVPGLAGHEPWGIRAAVLLLLVIAVASGGQAWQERLLRAMQPKLAGGGPAASAEVWITPPAYTARPPLFLRGDRSADAPATPALQIPAGSTVLARVAGVATVPSLRLGTTEIPFTSLASEQGAPTAYRAEMEVHSGDELSILSGRRKLAVWQLTVVPDRPPTVAAPTVADRTGNGLLDLAFEATDDYGVSKVIARIRPIGAGSSAEGEELRVPVTLSDPGAPVATGRALLDLAAHPWAGRQATLDLEASDLIGQTTIGPVSISSSRSGSSRIRCRARLSPNAGG